MKRNGGVIGGFLSERVADNAMLTQRCMVSFGHAIAPRLLPAVYDSFAPPNVNASVVECNKPDIEARNKNNHWPCKITT